MRRRRTRRRRTRRRAPETPKEKPDGGSLEGGPAYLTIGSVVALKGYREKKWCVDEGSRIVCNQADKAYEHFPFSQKFTIVRCGKNKVCLKSGKSKRFCTATSTSVVNCNSDSAFGPQYFSEEELGLAWDMTDSGYFALKGGKKQLYCDDEAKGIVCDKTEIPKTGHFTVSVISSSKS